VNYVEKKNKKVMRKVGYELSRYEQTPLKTTLLKVNDFIDKKNTHTQTKLKELVKKVYKLCYRNVIE
jgi:hypothetical protein